MAPAGSSAESRFQYLPPRMPADAFDGYHPVSFGNQALLVEGGDQFLILECTMRNSRNAALCRILSVRARSSVLRPGI